MTPEEKQLLTETASLVKENNKILRSIRRSARFASIMRAVYWLIILGSALFTYYTIEPYIKPVVDGYSGLMQNIESVKNSTSKLPTWLGGRQ